MLLFRRSLVFVVLALAAAVRAQTAPQVIPLWPNGAPGFERLKAVPEEAKDYWVKNVNNPSLTVYLPPAGKANGTAVVVAPGGGFRELVIDEEGTKPAKFLNSLGVAAFVLKYRLPNEEHSPYKLANVRQDALRAVRTVRSRAAEFGVDPARLGILGFSAGGALEMMVIFDKDDGDPAAADPVDRANGRPNFAMIIYPGGPPPKVVPADSPPAFLLAANDDEYGCDKVALALLERYKAAGRPVEAHFITRGKHAFNMGERSPYLAIRNWPQRMADWLSDSGFLPAPAAP